MSVLGIITHSMCICHLAIKLYCIVVYCVYLPLVVLAHGSKQVLGQSVYDCRLDVPTNQFSFLFSFPGVAGGGGVTHWIHWSSLWWHRREVTLCS